MRLEFPGAAGKPVAVVARNLGWLGVKSAQFPVVPLLLQNKRHGVGALRGGRIESDDAVIARRQIGNDENRAVSSLSLGAEDTAQEFGALAAAPSPRP